MKKEIVKAKGMKSSQIKITLELIRYSEYKICLNIKDFSRSSGFVTDWRNATLTRKLLSRREFTLWTLSARNDTKENDQAIVGTLSPKRSVFSFCFVLQDKVDIFSLEIYYVSQVSSISSFSLPFWIKILKDVLICGPLQQLQEVPPGCCSAAGTQPRSHPSDPLWAMVHGQTHSRLTHPNPGTPQLSVPQTLA